MMVEQIVCLIAGVFVGVVGSYLIGFEGLIDRWDQWLDKRLRKGE